MTDFHNTLTVLLIYKLTSLILTKAKRSKQWFCMMNKEGKGLPLYLVYYMWSGVVVGRLWCSCCRGSWQGRRTRSELWLPCALWSFALLTMTMFMSWCCCRDQQNLMGQGSVFHPGASMRTRDRRDPTNHILQHPRGKKKNTWLQPDCFWQFLKVNSKLLFPPTTHIYTTMCLYKRPWFKITGRPL